MKVYEIVKENIIKKIEETEKLVWHKEWEGYNFPLNYVSKKYYKGINNLLLPLGGEYLTFNQIKKMQEKNKNIKLKEGSKGNMVIFWKIDDKKQEKVENIENIEEIDITEIEEETEEEKDNKKSTKTTKIIARYYYVFHIKDVEGLKSRREIYQNEKKQDIEKFIEETLNKIGLKFEIAKGGDSCFYSPHKDIIVMPSINQFGSTDEYYKALFHELVHATGHESRLNRELKPYHKAKEEYSKEELIAEIGSEFLARYFSLKTNENNTPAYIKSWIKYLKDSPANLIISASSQAQKAVDYLLSK